MSSQLSFTSAIDIIIGPMYSGKSTELIRRLVIYHELGMKVLYINSQLDQRSVNDFSTHNSSIQTIPFSSIKVPTLEGVDVSGYDIVGVDEAQLFSNLAVTVLRWVEQQNKVIILAGLNGDYKRQKFGEVMDLVPYCDTITKLASFCLKCKRAKNEITQAHFTQRTVVCEDTVLIGGKELYQPVCRKCFINK